MILLAGNIRLVFWIAVLPAWVAVALLVTGIHEPAQHADDRPPRTLPHWRDLRQFSGAFWGVVVIGTLFTLARFSEAFLILRAHDAGLSLNWTPLALVVMNVTYVASAYPVGKLSDRVGRIGLLALGLLLLIVADILLAVDAHLGATLAGIAIWGLHLGLTQGLLSALVADTAPANLRGSAFGIFYLTSGVATLAASVVAGLLWETTGPPSTFFVGAAFSVAALAGLFAWRVQFQPR